MLANGEVEMKVKLKFKMEVEMKVEMDAPVLQHNYKGVAKRPCARR